MNNWIFILGLVAVMVLVLGVFAVVQNKKQMAIRKKHPGFPKGYWMNQGIGIGIAIGTGVGVALGNIAIGVAIGLAIGAGIGARLEKQHQDEVRPITVEEEKIRKQSILFGTVILLLGIVVFVIIFVAVK